MCFDHRQAGSRENMQNFTVAHDPLSLDRIRGILNRLEDTIIFSLIERAQFAHNPVIYAPGAFQELAHDGFAGSWLEWFLRGVESFHAQARRYTSPDEYPFTPLSALPPPIVTPLRFPKILHPNSINVNAAILKHYVRTIVPRVTRRASLNTPQNKQMKPNGNMYDGADASRDQCHKADGTNRADKADGDDGNYGSAATIDVEVLQAISKRVHYGKFVSESKFVANPALFIPPILARDRSALDALITKPEIEAALLRRLRKKAAIYAQDVEAGTDRVDVDGVVDLYESFIIPLTKEVEVEYLLHRLDGLTRDEIDKLRRKT